MHEPLEELDFATLERYGEHDLLGLIHFLEQRPPNDIEAERHFNKLLRLQTALASSRTSHAAVAQQFGMSEAFAGRLFSVEGRLLLNGPAEKLAHIRIGDRAMFIGRGRALGHHQLPRLCNALRTHAEGTRTSTDVAPSATQRDAARSNGVEPVALAYLFHAAGNLNLESVDALPQAQRDQVLSALHNEQATDRSTRLMRAHQRLTEEPMGARRLARVTGEHRGDLDRRFGFAGDSRGALLVSDVSHRLLTSNRGTPAAVVRYFQALPRALRPSDLKLLQGVRALHGLGADGASASNAPTPRAEAERAKVSPAALNFLFDPHTGRIRQERLESLPASQQEALQPSSTATAGTRPAAAMAPRLPGLQQRLRQAPGAAQPEPVARRRRAAPAQPSEPRGPREPREPRALRQPRRPADSPTHDVPRRELLTGSVVGNVLENLSQRPLLVLEDYRQVAEQHGLNLQQMDEVLLRGEHRTSPRPARVQTAAQRWERMRVEVLGAAARPVPLAPAAQAAAPEEVFVPRARRTPARRPAPVPEPPHAVRARIEAPPETLSWAGQRPRSQRPAAPQRMPADAAPQAPSPASPHEAEHPDAWIPEDIAGPGTGAALPVEQLPELDIDMPWLDTSPPRSGTP